MKEEIKTNPYSGVSFEYNGHTWGMCARDNGVEILVDGKVRTSVFEEPKLTDEALEKEVEKYCKDKGIVYEEDLNMLDFARHFAELSKHTGESAVNSQPKIEPKFKIGDKIRNKKLAVEDTIIDVKKDRYIFRKCALLMGFQDDWELVEEYVNFFNIEETIDEFFDQMQKFGEGKATLNWRETHLHISPEFLRHFANHVATRQKQQLMKNVMLETEVLRDSDGDGVDTPYESWLTLTDTEIPELPESLGLKEGDKVKVIIIKEDYI